MIRQLRKQFILTTMGILVIFFIVIVCLLNTLFHALGYHQNVSLLRQLTLILWGDLPNITETLPEGHPAEELLGDRLDTSPIYIATLTSEGELTNWIALKGTKNPSTEMIGILEEAVNTNDTTSQQLGDYIYAVNSQRDVTYLAVMDTTNSVESAMIQRLYTTSLLICVISLALLYPICIFLSRWVTRSAEYAFEQQKQFISDAGHELKTPLSIIAINAKVIQNQVGTSKHMDFIQTEIHRMHRLISQLLTLAQMESGTLPSIHIPFSLSDTIFQIALPFESVAFEKNIHYFMDIDEDIVIVGEQEQI